MRRLVSVFAVLFIFSAVLLAQPALRHKNYIYVPIPIAGATSSVASGINNAGAVVGTFVDAGGAQHGFLIQNGQFTILNFHSGSTVADSTVANAINNTGIVTGYYLLDGFPHAYTYDSQTTVFTELPNFFPQLGSPPFVNPAGINAAGKITGSFRTIGVNVGFVIDASGFHSLDNLLGPSSAFNLEHEFPSGISDAGTIVGWGVQPAKPPCFDLSFIIAPDQTVRLFELPGFCALLTAISSSEEWLAGNAQSADRTTNVGFALNAGKAVAVQYPGATRTSVSGVNSVGVVVGAALVNNAPRAFVAIPLPERRKF